MDVLIVKRAALGDVLRTTSVTRRLKALRPACRIVWVTSRAALPLLLGNPDLDEVLPIEGRPRFSRAFDLVLSLEEDLACARLARRACRGELIGVYEDGGLRYTRSSTLYYGMSALNRDPDGGLARADRLKAENRLSYARIWLKILGLSAPKDAAQLRPVLALEERERTVAARGVRLPGGTALSRAIGFNPGAGPRWPAKQLSIEAAARLARALASLGRPVLLLGGPGESERNRRIARLARGAALEAGTRGLRQFAGLVSWLAGVVTTDSLAFHVSAALAKPTVALVGPTSAAELEVFGPGALLQPESCSCFYRAECATPPSCLDRLPPQAVLRALSRCLKG